MPHLRVSRKRQLTPDKLRARVTWTKIDDNTLDYRVYDHTEGSEVIPDFTWRFTRVQD